MSFGNLLRLFVGEKLLLGKIHPWKIAYFGGNWKNTFFRDENFILTSNVGANGLEMSGHNARALILVTYCSVLQGSGKKRKKSVFCKIRHFGQNNLFGQIVETDVKWIVKSVPASVNVTRWIRKSYQTPRMRVEQKFISWRACLKSRKNREIDKIERFCCWNGEN